MITPFEESLVREIKGRRVISAGVSSYGYDLRLAPDGFRVFSPIASAEIDPKNFDENSLIEAPLRRGEDYLALRERVLAYGVEVLRPTDTSTTQGESDTATDFRYGALIGQLRGG